MFKIDKLTLITGADIYLPEFDLWVKQPTLKEIGRVGEIKFFQTLNTFYPPKEPMELFIRSLGELGESAHEKLIDSLTEFDYFHFLLQATEMADGERAAPVKEYAQLAFSLLIPTHKLDYNPELDVLLLIPIKGGESIVVESELFAQLKSIVGQIFKFDELVIKTEDDEEMSPAAKRIADKIAEGERRIKEQRGEVDDEGEFLSRIVSILAMQTDLSTLINMTIYQLLNHFERFNLYTSHQHSVRAKTAGADVEIEDWYKTI